MGKSKEHFNPLHNDVTRRQFFKISFAAGLGVVLNTPASQYLSPPTQHQASWPSSAAQPTTLNVLAFAQTTEGIESQLDAFSKLYPGVKVNFTITGYDDVHNTLTETISKGAGVPDLCAIDTAFIADYSDNLTDLTDLAKSLFDKFVSPTVSLASYKGKFYGLPTDAEPMGVFYRKDIWDQYGLDPAQVRTWSDLADMGDMLSDASNGKVFLYSQTDNRPELFEVFAVSQGFSGYYFSVDDSKVIVDDPKMIEAVTVLKRLWNGKGVLKNPSDAVVYYKNDTLASELVGPAWYMSAIKGTPELSGKWRLMHTPAVTAGSTTTGYQFPTIFVIPKLSSNVQMAWDLARLGLTEGAQVLYDKFSILPAYQPLLDKIRDTPDPFFGGQKVNQLWVSLAKDAPQVSFGTGFKKAQLIIGDYLAKILHDQTSVEQGLRDAAAEMRKTLHKA